jgi:hypothetical protein
MLWTISWILEQVLELHSDFTRSKAKSLSVNKRLPYLCHRGIAMLHESHQIMDDFG